MLEIHPSIVIGVGPRAQRAVQGHVALLQQRYGPLPTVLSMVVDFAREGGPLRLEGGSIQHLTISAPVFGEDEVWPHWLPLELIEMTPTEREHTRAWMHAALLQQADELQELLFERIPHLTSFAAIEELGTAGLSLSGDGRIGIYVIADLGDHLGSSVFVDLVYMTYAVCQQLGMRPATTGVLLLPDATSPAPAAEALAYAALKELEHAFQRRAYNDASAPDWATASALAPFQDGCYLVDNVNELGYTLDDPEQQTATLAQWLHAMTMLGMQDAVRTARRRRYLKSTLGGRARAYESFGLALRYIPQDVASAWASAELRRAAIRPILAEPDADTAPARAAAFAGRIHLDHQALREELRQRAQPRQRAQVPSIEGALDALQRGSLGQVERAARATLQQMRRTHLTALEEGLSQAGEQVRQEMQQALRDALHEIEGNRLGPVVAEERAFLQHLQARLSAVRVEIEGSVQRHRQQLKRSLSQVSDSAYALRQAMMSLPQWPVWALSVVALLILPLAYLSLLISQVIRPLDGTWAAVAWAILVLGVLGVLAYLAYRLSRMRRRVARQHEEMIRERFDLESSPLYSRAMRAICSALQETLDRATADLETLDRALQTVAARAAVEADEAARALEDLAAPGPIRSVIGRRQGERIAARLDARGDAFVERAQEELGLVAEWRGRAKEAGQTLAEWLDARLRDVGSAFVDAWLAQFTLFDLMAEAAPGVALDRDLQRMLDSARPLWSYDPRTLRRGKTARITLAGGDASASGWERVIASLRTSAAQPVAVDTGDPGALVVLCLHRGMPVFALRRIGEYRAHYAEMLWQSKLPLHTTRAARLDDDLYPKQRRARRPAVVLFAGGLAMGIIGRDADGRYRAPRPRGDSIVLSRHKDRSVALMSMDGAACRAVQRQLDALLNGTSRDAASAALDEYVTSVPDLEDWEVEAILALQRTYDLEPAED
ncbi:MAG TPA: tubulin-like doman-containing protein [Anaerolineae bacterium]|nr:tubulin-like doman-containing protein [Anaerolineae bacterium]